jgi:Divergent InlB B-repeat domain
LNSVSDGRRGGGTWPSKTGKPANLPPLLSARDTRGDRGTRSEKEISVSRVGEGRGHQDLEETDARISTPLALREKTPQRGAHSQKRESGGRGAPGSPARASRARSYTQTMKWKWRAVGVVVPFVIAYFIASAIGRPVHLDHVSTVSSAGPTSSKWYLIVGEGTNQVRLAIPGTFKDLRTRENQWRLAPVLLARKHIPKGMSGELIAWQGMYAATTLPRNSVEADAIPDPRYLKGRAAVVEIFPGQQLIGRDFTANAFPPADPVQVTSLTVTAIGQGTVSAGGLSVACEATTGYCEHGSAVHSGLLRLEASPAPGWKFTSWVGLGCRPKTSPTCVVRVTLLSARFEATFVPRSLQP